MACCDSAEILKALAGPRIRVCLTSGDCLEKRTKVYHDAVPHAAGVQGLLLQGSPSRARGRGFSAPVAPTQPRARLQEPAPERRGREEGAEVWAEGGVTWVAAASQQGVTRVWRKPVQWFLRRRKSLHRCPFRLMCQQVRAVLGNRGVSDAAISRPWVALNFAT